METTTTPTPHLLLPPIWYLPSFYGDITLKTLDKDTTKVSWENLTESERKALENLVRYAEGKKWKTEDVPEAFQRKGAPMRGHSGTGALTIHKRLATVKNRLAKDLKPGRSLVDVVQFKSGEIVEHSVAPIKEPPVRGTTVAAPTVGCAVPTLEAAEIKARAVLMAFLDDDQASDFMAHNRFMSAGAATGHRYMVTSRYEKDNVARDVHGQLFDLTDDNPLCVHDYTVPAAEEMLALHLLLQIPEREMYMRGLVL